MKSPVDDAMESLRAAGWSAGEMATAIGWYVYAYKGPLFVRAEGRTQAEAWQRAVEQSRLASSVN